MIATRSWGRGGGNGLRFHRDRPPHGYTHHVLEARIAELEKTIEEKEEREREAEQEREKREKELAGSMVSKAELEKLEQELLEARKEVADLRGERRKLMEELGSWREKVDGLEVGSYSSLWWMRRAVVQCDFHFSVRRDGSSRSLRC